VYYLCYYLWRHNGERFSQQVVPEVEADAFKGASRGTSFVFFCLFGTTYAIYASAWASKSVHCQSKTNCWALGSTHGLVSLTPPCAFYVPTRRATLPGLHSSTLDLMTSAFVPANGAATVLLPGHREGFITFRRGGITNGRCRLPTFSFVSFG
jgi:hypothetical protein